jgi:hypothetical protein
MDVICGTFLFTVPLLFVYCLKHDESTLERRHGSPVLSACLGGGLTSHDKVFGPAVSVLKREHRYGVSEAFEPSVARRFKAVA